LEEDYCDQSGKSARGLGTEKGPWGERDREVFPGSQEGKAGNVDEFLEGAAA